MAPVSAQLLNLTGVGSSQSRLFNLTDGFGHHCDTVPLNTLVLRYLQVDDI